MHLVSSHLMWLLEDVLHVKEMVSRKLKCNFYLMFMSNAMSVTERDTTQRHWVLCIKEKTLLIF